MTRHEVKHSGPGVGATRGLQVPAAEVRWKHGWIHSTQLIRTRPSKAIGKEMPISPKYSREICRMVRGKNIDVAIKMLEEVIELQEAGAVRRYNIGVAHKTGVGPGRFPKKSAAAILKVIAERQAQRRVQGPGRREHEGQGHNRPPRTDHPRAHAPRLWPEHPVEPADRQHRGHPGGGSVNGKREEVHS